MAADRPVLLEARLAGNRQGVGRRSGATEQGARA